MAKTSTRAAPKVIVLAPTTAPASAAMTRSPDIRWATLLIWNGSAPLRYAAPATASIRLSGAWARFATEPTADPTGVAPGVDLVVLRPSN
jgi:hypothetical protein